MNKSMDNNSHFEFVNSKSSPNEKVRNKKRKQNTLCSMSVQFVRNVWEGAKQFVPDKLKFWVIIFGRGLGRCGWGFQILAWNEFHC